MSEGDDLRQQIIGVVASVLNIPPEEIDETTKIPEDKVSAVIRNATMQVIGIDTLDMSQMSNFTVGQLLEACQPKSHQPEPNKGTKVTMGLCSEQFECLEQFGCFVLKLCDCECTPVGCPVTATYKTRTFKVIIVAHQKRRAGDRDLYVLALSSQVERIEKPEG